MCNFDRLVLRVLRLSHDLSDQCSGRRPDSVSQEHEGEGLRPEPLGHLIHVTAWPETLSCVDELALELEPARSALLHMLARAVPFVHNFRQCKQASPGLS